jgi:hypothetical protein
MTLPCKRVTLFRFGSEGCRLKIESWIEFPGQSVTRVPVGFHSPLAFVKAYSGDLKFRPQRLVIQRVLAND